MYINLIFPVICLYVLPKMRLEANKMVEKYTAVYAFGIIYVSVIFYIWNTACCISCNMYESERHRRECDPAESWCHQCRHCYVFYKKAVANYYFGIYSYPYAALYFGVCVTLIIKNVCDIRKERFCKTIF